MSKRNISILQEKWRLLGPNKSLSPEKQCFISAVLTSRARRAIHKHGFTWKEHLLLGLLSFLAEAYDYSPVAKVRLNGARGDILQRLKNASCRCAEDCVVGSTSYQKDAILQVGTSFLVMGPSEVRQSLRYVKKFLNEICGQKI